METKSPIKLTQSYLKREETPSEFKTIIEYIKNFADKISDNEALVFVSTDERRIAVTWSQLYERSKTFARALIAFGIKRDEIVAMNVRECPEWVYVTLGAMMIGAKSANIRFNFKDGSDVIGAMSKLEKCAMLIIDPGKECSNWQVVKKLIDHVENATGRVRSERMPYLRYLIGYEPFEEKQMPELMTLEEVESRSEPDIPLPKINENDTAYLFNSSGSSGNPKIVEHTHRSIISSGKPPKGTPADIHGLSMYNDRPFSWIGGSPFNFINGTKRILMNGFCDAPSDYLAFVAKTVIKEKCFMLSFQPGMLNELWRRYDELNLSAVGHLLILSGGQPFRRSLLEEMPFSKCFVLNGYGATEIGFVSGQLVTDINMFSDYMCGYPAEGCEVKVVDENGDIVPVNTNGEIYIRTPGVMKGYFNDPDKTANVMTSDGWYKTDDVGRMSEYGILFVEGRKSNVITCNGIQIMAEILENIFEICPGVKHVAIVPIPDKQFHQLLCACVVRLPGSDITEEEVKTFCEEYHNDKVGNMASKLPTYYLILESLPVTYTGKLDRVKLTKMAVERVRKE